MLNVIPKFQMLAAFNKNRQILFEPTLDDDILHCPNCQYQVIFSSEDRKFYHIVEKQSHCQLLTSIIITKYLLKT